MPEAGFEGEAFFEATSGGLAFWACGLGVCRAAVEPAGLVFRAGAEGAVPVAGRALVTRALAAGLVATGVAGTINKLPALRSSMPVGFSAVIRWVVVR